MSDSGDLTQNTWLAGLLGLGPNANAVPPQAFLAALQNVVRALNAQTQATKINPFLSYTFATLPASPGVGLVAVVTDSNTNVWGANIAGGGANKVLAIWGGSQWTVVGKLI